MSRCCWGTARRGFTAATGSPFGVGSDPGSLVVGDFNADGIQDLATTNYLSNNVTVLLGNGSGGSLRLPRAVLSRQAYFLLPS